MVRVKNFFFITLFLCVSAWADNNVASLIEQRERPTISEIMPSVNALSSLGFQQPKQNTMIFDWQYWLASMQNHAPKFIAMLETSFPGATWAFIGRDSSFLADIAESFFLSVGQSGRVIRIGASKPTFEGLDDASIISYLRGKGLDPDNLLRRPPFILVDTVSRGSVFPEFGNANLSGRQGRRILSALYNHHVSLGGRPSDLLDQVNMVGLSVVTFKGPHFPVENIKQHLQSEKVRYENERISTGFFYQHRIPTWADPGDRFLEISYDHFTGAWNQRYERLSVVNQNGQLAVRETPGAPNPNSQRNDILLMQFHIAAMMKGTAFQNEVIREAQQMGVNLSYQHSPQYDARLGNHACTFALKRGA